jgi:hypothetical protein
MIRNVSQEVENEVLNENKQVVIVCFYGRFHTCVLYERNLWEAIELCNNSLGQCSLHEIIGLLMKKSEISNKENILCKINPNGGNLIGLHFPCQCTHDSRVKLFCCI